MNKEEKQFRQLFQSKKAIEKLGTPEFSTIFLKAQRRKQTKDRTKRLLMVASIAVLAIIGFAVNDDNLPINMEQVTIVKGSIGLYEKLMEDGKIITNDIHFEYDRVFIKPNSYPTLKAIAKIMLQKNKSIHLSIEGHTDSTGSVPYNQALSRNRAKAVRVALIKMGVAGERLTAEGFGETRPLNSNETEADRALNRRVEFVLKK